MNLDAYIDSNGLVSGNGLNSGNGLLYTAEAIIIGLPYEKERALKSVMWSCKVLPGLWQRSPNNYDLESFDDYLGLVSCDIDMAKEVLTYGKKRFFYFNNTPKFTLKAWLGRNPSFVAHLYRAAGQKPMILLDLAWFFAVAFAGFFNRLNQDAWILAGVMIRGDRAQSFLSKLAAKLYTLRLRRYYSSLGDVMAQYFGFEHPLAEMWKHWP